MSEALENDPQQEDEATAFAIELLMPADWIRRDWTAEQKRKRGPSIKRMAKRYGVSDTMMAARLVSLKLPIPVE